MNQGRIWCVVKPTVGLPLFLGSVTTIALLVHTAVLTNTDWMSRYWQGDRAPARTGDSGASPSVASAAGAVSVTVTPTVNADGAPAFTVTVAPAPQATPMANLAQAGPPPLASQ